MDVRMPDGTIIRNVPEDMAQDDLLSMYRQHTGTETGGLGKAFKEAYYGAKGSLEEAVGLHDWAKEAKEAQQKVGYIPTSEEDVAQAQGLAKVGL